MPMLKDTEVPEGYEEVAVPKSKPTPTINSLQESSPEGYEEIGGSEIGANANYVPRKLKGTRIEKDWPFLRSKLFEESDRGFDLEVDLNEGDFRKAVQYHWGVGPDVAAKAYRIAKEGNGVIPTEAVLRNKEELFQWQEAARVFNKVVGGTEITENGKPRIKHKYPYTANWIRDPDRMAIGKDDIDNLTMLEGIAIRYNRPKYEGYYHEFKEGVKDLGRYGLANLEALRTQKLLNDQEFYSNLKEIFGESEFFDSMKPFIEYFYRSGAERTTKSIADIKDMRHGDFLKSIPLAREGGLKDVAYDFFHLLPQFLGTVGATATTGVLGGAAFTSQYIFGSSYADLTDAGVTHERATMAALGNTTAQTALELLPLGKLFSLVKATGPREAVKKAFGYLFAEAGTEFLQEFPEALSHLWATREKEYAALSDEDARRAFVSEFVDQLPETIVRGAYSGLLGAMMGAFAGSVKIPYEVARGMRTRNQMAHLNEEVQTIEKSKLKERSPELLDEFSNGVYETHGVSKDINIPIEKIEKFFQDNPDGLKTFLEDMAVYEQYNDSPTTEELTVDRASFIRKYSNSELWNFMRDDIRFDVNGLTVEETKALKENIKENLNDLQQEYNNQIKKNRLPTQAVPIWKTLTKKFGAEKAEYNMSIFLAMADQLSTRRGETVQQWFDRVQPRVKIEEGAYAFGDKIYKQQKKGSVEFTDSGALIKLYDSADLSTFLHESFHVVTKDIASYIESGHADELTKSQYNTLLEFTNGKLDQAGYEKLASAFELYLREGKAPSVELTDAFRAVKTWLTNIYKSLSRFDFKLNDDVRGVFDRLLASEQQIQEVQSYYSAKQGVQDLIPLPPEKKRELVLQKEKADGISIDYQVKKNMAAFMRAIGNKDHFKELADKELSKQRVYQVLDYLKDNKLDYQELEDQLGKERLDDLKGRHEGIVDLKGKDGTSLIELVMLYDYKNENEALADITNAKNRNEAINDRAKELVKETEDGFKELLSKGEDITGEEAFHHEAQLSYMIAQAEILRQHIERARERRVQRLEAKVFRDAARDRIDQMPLWKSTRYKDFAAAEKRYGQKAIALLKKGELVEAHEALKMQAINHAMVISSVEARQQRQKIERRYQTKKVNSALENVEYNFRKAAKDAINFYKFNEAIVSKDQGALLDIPYLSDELAQTIPAWILRKDTPKTFNSYRDLTFGQYKEVDQAIRNIMTFGRDEMKSMKKGLYNTITAHIEASVPKIKSRRDKRILDKNKGIDKLVNKLDSALADYQIMSFLFERLDNYSYTINNEAGPSKSMYDRTVQSEVKTNEVKSLLYKNLDTPLNIINKANRRIEKEYNVSKSPFSSNSFDIKGAPIPEVKRQKGILGWTTEQLNTFFYNLGNPQNREILLKTYGYSPEQIDILTSHYTTKEWKNIQKVWDPLEMVHPLISKVFFNLHNKELGKVEGSEFSVLTKDGERITLEGGYYPLSYDFAMSDNISGSKKDSMAELDRDIMLDERANVLRTKPDDRMTKERVKTNNNVIDLSYNVLFNHIDATSRYIGFAETLRDLNMVIKNPKWKKAVIEVEGPQMYKAIEKWASYLANPKSNRTNRNALDPIIDWQRRVGTYSILGLNLGVGAKQRLSLFNAANEVGMPYLLKGIKDIGITGNTFGTENIKTIQDTFDKSKFLQLRSGNIDKNLSEYRHVLKPDSLKFEIGGKEFSSKDVQDFVFAFINMNDRATVAAVWNGAVHKYIDNNGPDLKKAYAYADHVVETTQPISIPSTMNEFMRSDGPTKLFTSFMTFQFLAGNRYIHYYNAWKDGKITKPQYFKHLLYENIAPAWVPKIAGLLAFGGTLELWDYLFAPVEEVAGKIPLAREVPHAVKYYKSGGNLSIPAFKGFETGIKAAGAIKKSMNKNREWLKTTMSIGEALELQAGVPAIKFVKEVDKIINKIKKRKPIKVKK